MLRLRHILLIGNNPRPQPQRRQEKNSTRTSLKRASSWFFGVSVSWFYEIIKEATAAKRERA
jgi:hypothetical protein